MLDSCTVGPGVRSSSGGGRQGQEGPAFAVAPSTGVDGSPSSVVDVPRSSASSASLIPRLPSVSSSLQFFGDSFSAGTGAVPSSRRFSSLIAAQLGVTERNSALGGTNWPQLCLQFLNANNDDGVSPSHILTGYNDNQQGPTPTLPGLTDQDLSSHGHCMVDALLFLGTRGDDKVQFRKSQAVRWFPTAAAWSDSPFFSDYGALTSTSGAAVQFTVTGRYVVVSALAFSQASLGCYWQLQVDGVDVSTPSVISIRANPNSSSILQPVTLLYDTASSATTSHMVRLTNLHPNGISVHLNWACAITPHSTVTRTVYVGDAARGWWHVVPNGGGSEMRRQTLSRMLQDAVELCRGELGLDVQWIPYKVMWNLAHLNSDFIHPNNAGHREYAAQLLAIIRPAMQLVP